MTWTQGAADDPLGRPDTLGVIGGMGPLATADFLHKLVVRTPATSDVEHIPVIVGNFPQIADRVAPIMDGVGPSPLPGLRAAAERLVDAGAQCLVMPCNTAHHWYDALCEGLPTPLLHIVDAVAQSLDRTCPGPSALGLIATEATIHAKLYPARLEPLGHRFLVPTEHEMKSCILPGIRAAKAGRLADAGTFFARVINRLRDRGGNPVILACTEVGPALATTNPGLAARCIDSTEALADAAIAWALKRRLGANFV